jgi:hypothetical protein
MPDECVAFSQLRKRYLGLTRQVIDQTNLLLKTPPCDRDVQQAEAHRLVGEFFKTQEAFAKHRREHPVHGQILEEVLYGLADVVVVFCRDGALIQTREAIVAKLHDKELARGLLFSSEQWFDCVTYLAKLIERINGQHSDETPPS